MESICFPRPDGALTDKEAQILQVEYQGLVVLLCAVWSCPYPVYSACYVVQSNTTKQYDDNVQTGFT